MNLDKIIKNLKIIILFTFKVGANIEDHIPCLKYFDYEAGYDFLQNTIFLIDKRHKQTDTTELLNNKNAKLRFDRYLVFEISFKFISVKLDQKVQFKYLDILDFKLVKKEHEIVSKILQLRNLIENPDQLMEKSKYIASFVDTKSVIETKYCAESKYFNDSKSLFEIKNDSFEDNKIQNDNKQLQQLQVASEKKISFHFDTSQQQSSPPQLTTKISKSQRFEITQKDQSPKCLSTQNQNLNEFRLDDLQLQSPKMTEDQLIELNILSTRDIKSARFMLEPTQQDQQSRYQENKIQTQTYVYKKSQQQVSITESNFKKDEIQQVVSNKDTSLNSKSSTYKNRIPKKIKQKRMSCNLRYFSMIGFFSLFQLVIVNWVVYIISDESISRFQQQFKIISNPMSMYMRSLEILRQISYYYFLKEYEESIPIEERYDEMDITDAYQMYVLDAFKKDFIQLIEAHDNQILLQFLSGIKLEIKDKMQIDNNFFYYVQTIQQTDLFKTLKDYLTSAYHMYYFFDNNREKFMWENIIHFKQKIFIFQDFMKDDMFQLLYDCQNNNFITLIIVAISSIFLMVVVLVVIYVQQMQKKKIISLLGCFTPEILADQSDRLEELVFQYKQKYVFNKSRRRTLFFDTNIHKNLLNQRKQNYNDCKKDFINRMKENQKNNFNVNCIKIVHSNPQINDDDDSSSDKTSNQNNDEQVNQNQFNDLNNNNIVNPDQNMKQEDYIDIQNENQINFIKSTEMIDIKKSHNLSRKLTNIARKQIQFTDIKKVNYVKSASKIQKKPNQDYDNQSSHKRKRIQASFDTYKALKYRHLILGLIIICILNCKSVINIILFEPYAIEQKWLIEEKIKMYDLQATVVQNASPQFVNLEHLYNGFKFFESPYYQFINYQQKENQEKLLLVKTLAIPADFTLHDEYQYKDFYMEMLLGNICSARQKYPQYVLSNFTSEECNFLYESILSKGLLFAINKAYIEVNSIKDIYDIDGYDFEESNYEIEINYIEKQINGHSSVELNHLLKFIYECIESVTFYYHNISDSYTEQITHIFFCMFILQIVLVLVLVITIWLCVNKKLKYEMNQAKQYFTLFNINILSTNSPLNQYFTEFSY